MTPTQDFLEIYKRALPGVEKGFDEASGTVQR